MIRLLVVSHACFTAINRGVYQLLRKWECDVELVVPEMLRIGSTWSRAEAQRSVDPPIHYLPLAGHNPRTYAFRGLTRLLRERRPSIVLLDNDPVSRMANSIGRWTTRNGAALYCISNENMALQLTDSLRRRGASGLIIAMLKRWMLFRNRPLIRGLFVINRDGKRIFESEGFQDVRIMPLGFDPKYFYQDPIARNEVRASLGVDGPLIAYFGRVTPEKGIDVLISALGEIKDLRWHLMMDSFQADASDYHKKIASLVEERLINDRVTYVHPSHEDIARYMNAADLIVVPSVSTPTWKEQYGRVVAEAMACGKWIICSRTGALPDVLGGFGCLVEEGDVGALAKAMRIALAPNFFNTVASDDIAAYADQHLSIEKQAEVFMAAFAARFA